MSRSSAKISGFSVDMIEARASDQWSATREEAETMAKGIKKISADPTTVKKQRVTDLTISWVDSGDRGAGDGCRVMLIKRDPVLVAIDRAFADHWLGIDNAFANRSSTAPAARGLTGGRPDCPRSSIGGSGRFDGTPCGRPIQPTNSRVFPPAPIFQMSRATAPSPIATLPAASDRTLRRGWQRPRATTSRCRPLRAAGRRISSARPRDRAMSGC